MNVKRVVTAHRHSLAAAIAAPAVLGFAGCGAVPVSPSASPSTVTVAPPVTSEPTSAAPVTTKHPRSTQSRPSETKAPQTRPCHPSEVDVRFDPGTLADLEKANNNQDPVHTELLVTNTGNAACEVTGFPGIQGFDSEGKSIPTTVHQSNVFPADQRILDPGRTASANVEWSIFHEPCIEPYSVQIALPGNKKDVTTMQWVMGGVCGGFSVTTFGPR